MASPVARSVGMIIQGEKVLGPRVGNLRIRARDRIYHLVSGEVKSDEYEVREFTCDWFEKLLEEIEILDIRLNSIYYRDLYFLSKDGGYTVVGTWWQDGEDMFFNAFGVILAPTCNTVEELAREMKTRGFDAKMIDAVKAYDPERRAPR